MGALVRKSAELGEVVEAVFDKAAHYSADPKEVSRLATAPSPSSWALGGGPCGPRGGRRCSSKSCCE